MKHVQTPTAAPTTEEREPPKPDGPQSTDVHRLFDVPLTAEDVLLIRACSSWICRLGPAPDVRARLVHLEQQLAGARPAP